MFCARVAMEVVEGPSVSTGSRSTTRLGRAARVELTSTTGMFKRLAQRRGASDRTQARVDGFAWVKRPSGICSGRVLHRSYLRGHRAKGSADVRTAREHRRESHCASGGGRGGLIVTLPNRYDCITVPCGARRFAGLRDTPSPDRPSDRRHRHTAALTAALATTTMITATLATTSLVMTTVTYMLHRLHNRYTSEILAA